MDHSRRYLPQLAFIALTGLGACGEDPPVETPVCCVNGASAVQRTGACEVGEISSPLSRCASTDAGVTCGDGLYQPATEACDPSAAAAPSCTSPATCTDCQCAGAVCGDGIINGMEGCERNVDCDAMQVCLRCECGVAGDRIVFQDTVNDVLGSQSGLTLERLGLALDGGEDDLVAFGLGDPSGLPRDRISEVCWVIVVDASTEQRLCLVRQADGSQSMTVKASASAARPLMPPDGELVNELNLNYAVRFKTSLGLRTEPALSFFAEAIYDGMVIDRLPDTGTLSFTEVFGK